MAEFHVARQPIFDAHLHVAAYELLFRDRAGAPAAQIASAGGATASVLLNGFGELGLDALVGAADAFVNVPAELLIDDVPLPEPASRVVVELLEDAVVTPELIQALARAKRRGYRIALDDFVPTPGTEPLLRAADLVKLDVLALGDELEDHVAALRRYGVPLLAEKIETHEELDRCRRLGFSWFQGYFLARPRTLASRTAATGASAVVPLLATLQDPEVGPEELAATIERDVALSYKILRYVNSAFFSLARTVASVREAVTLLGMKPVRRWASLLALAGMDDQPQELVTTALVRARTCELLAPRPAEADAYYTTGLFSVVDAMLGLPLDEVLEKLPLDPAIRRALLAREGRPGKVLAAMEHYERGELEAVEPELCKELAPAYLDALQHADGLLALGAAA